MGELEWLFLDIGTIGLGSLSTGLTSQPRVSQAKEIGFDRSLFERLMIIGKEKHTLARQLHGQYGL